MYFVYILKSLKKDFHYYGSTKDLNLRLREHNYGHVRSTKANRPYVIHYFETFKTKSEALEREKFFKSINGYNWLKQKKIL